MEISWLYFVVMERFDCAPYDRMIKVDAVLRRTPKRSVSRGR